MKKFLMLLPLALVLVLSGCDEVDISTGAGWGADRISFGSGWGHGGWDYRGSMHRRQGSWRDHNDRHWGGRPGWGGGRGNWGGGRGHGGWGGGHGGGHGGWGGHGGHHFLAEGVVAESDAAPALTQEDIAAYTTIGKAYGISTAAATKMMESLNRAAVGDFGGLADLGLSQNILARVKSSDGRLSSAELDRLSRALGVSQQKADAIIQDVLKK